MRRRWRQAIGRDSLQIQVEFQVRGGRLDPEVVAHLKASLPLTGALECYASVGNLADEDYEQKLGYAREGRTVRVGLEFEL